MSPLEKPAQKATPTKKQAITRKPKGQAQKEQPKNQPKKKLSKNETERLLQTLVESFNGNTQIFSEALHSVILKSNIMGLVLEELYKKQMGKPLVWEEFQAKVEAKKMQEEMSVHPKDAIIFGGDYKG